MNISVKSMVWIALGLLVGHIALLLWMGQPLICTCDMVKVWEGVVLSSGNSQHISDWYTPSHIIHGLLFYLVLWLLFPKLPIGTRLLLAMGIEITWEIFENTPFVINKYREQALAQGYTGDSVINSFFDILAMMFGFFLAWRLPLWATVFIGVALEVWVGITIRDNLTLNILNFIYQFDSIRQWQLGG